MKSTYLLPFYIKRTVLLSSNDPLYLHHLHKYRRKTCDSKLSFTSVQVLVRNVPPDPDESVSELVEHFFLVNHPDHYLTHQVWSFFTIITLAYFFIFVVSELVIWFLLFECITLTIFTIYNLYPHINFRCVQMDSYFLVGVNFSVI